MTDGETELANTLHVQKRVGQGAMFAVVFFMAALLALVQGAVGAALVLAGLTAVAVLATGAYVYREVDRL